MAICFTLCWTSLVSGSWRWHPNCSNAHPTKWQNHSWIAPVPKHEDCPDVLLAITECVILHVLISFHYRKSQWTFLSRLRQLPRLDYCSSSHVSHIWQHMRRWNAWICLRVLTGLLIEERLHGSGIMQLTERQMTLVHPELIYMARIVWY